MNQLTMKSIKSRDGITIGREMTECVRYQWIHNIRHCSAIHVALVTLATVTTKSTNQHEEVEYSWRGRDQTDIQNIFQWFAEVDPFDSNMSTLTSLSTEIRAK